MELRDRWNHLLPDAKPLGQDLLGRYAEPHRAYHDQQHLTEMLDTIDELAGEATDPDSVRLAAWFHDAVYDPEAPAGANEESSAQLAEAELAAYGLGEDKIAEVGRLVRLTASHTATDGDSNGAVLCDADLRILAADRRRYDEYTAAVRREYAHVPDTDFRRGRAAVLEKLGDGRIFTTKPARRRWERPARDNLDRELRGLRGVRHRWGGYLPLVYLGTSLGLVLGASVLFGRAVAAAPSWPVPADGGGIPGWWAPIAGIVIAGLVLSAWRSHARPLVMLALCAPLTLLGVAGVVIARLRWPEVTDTVAMSERWPYLLLASIAVLLGGVLLAVGCRLRAARRYAVSPRRFAGSGLIAVVGAVVTLLVILAGDPFAQARVAAANTISTTAPEPPATETPVRLDGELAWTKSLDDGGQVAGTAGGLAELRPGGVVTYDAATGKERWSYRRADVTTATGPQSHGLIVSPDRQTLAVNLPRGERTGRIDLPTYAVLDAVSGRVLAEVHTGGNALAVDRDRLIVAEGDHLVGYPTGNASRWRIRTDCPVAAAEVVAGTVATIGSCANGGPQTVRGLDEATGIERWTVDATRQVSTSPGTTEQPAAQGYQIGDIVAVPGTRMLAGIGWSPESGGTLYQWAIDTGEGTVTWYAPVPGSPRPQPGSGGSCVPALQANEATVVLVACRQSPAGPAQVYDVAAANPADGTPQWHHLMTVPPAVTDAWYPRDGFTVLGDGRVVTLLPSGDTCVPVTIGTTGVEPHPLVAGEVTVPTTVCDQPHATLAGAGRPVLAGATAILALR